VTPVPPAVSGIDKADAYRFLNQASFGATENSAAELIESGYESWIEKQMQLPASSQLPHLQSLPVPTISNQRQADRIDIWFRNAVNADDQLRQRVAFALSELFVVSELGALNDLPWSMADFYDQLSRHAFGNYRDLLEVVTLHPAMGVYLSMLGNQKPDPSRNIRPDENYAREVMQLFSIGLVALNNDGTQVLDSNMRPVPTYNQAVIEGFAQVFTGWSYAGFQDMRQAYPTRDNQVQAMQLYPEFHDTGAKTLLDGTQLPAGQSGEQDLAAALDKLFAHPNVGPFVALRLIQRLTSSNPSSAYIDRVAAAFNNNGAGVRGDLAAVIKAVLLDPEARTAIAPDTGGKIKEPLLRLTQLWRSYNAVAASGRYYFPFAYVVLGQGPQQSPSVFNFFSPLFAPPGEIRDRRLTAPELQIATEYQNTFVTNWMFYQAFFFNWMIDRNAADYNEDSILIKFAEEAGLADDPVALVDRVADKLLGGEISDALREEAVGMLLRLPASKPTLRAAEAIYLVATSPEYAYQR
jgi:uncharacterized protein (DUF1800 family)